MWTLIIIAVLAAYCAVIIRKKVKDVKAGKFCSCGCESCSAKCHKEMK